MEQKKVESDDEFVERHLDKVKGRISELAEERKQYTEEYCDQCDGCGWYEGGPTIKTTCEHCGGTGKILKKKVESLDVPKESHEQYTAKLLPCPLCDGKAGETVFSTGYINPGNYGVKCVACSLEIHSDRIDKVIGVWNTRNELADLRALHVKYLNTTNMESPHNIQRRQGARSMKQVKNIKRTTCARVTPNTYQALSMVSNG